MSAAPVAELVAKMLNYSLFVIFWHGKGPDITPKLHEHLSYMIQLERDGKLFASGPMGQREEQSGMTIVRAQSPGEANEIAMQDPFFKAGFRDFTIKPWTIMEGSFSVTVNYSDGRFNVR